MNYVFVDCDDQCLSKMERGCIRSQGIEIKLLFVVITTIDNFESILLISDSYSNNLFSSKKKKIIATTGIEPAIPFSFCGTWGKIPFIIIEIALHSDKRTLVESIVCS